MRKDDALNIRPWRRMGDRVVYLRKADGVQWVGVEGLVGGGGGGVQDDLQGSAVIRVRTVTCCPYDLPPFMLAFISQQG